MPPPRGNSTVLDAGLPKRADGAMQPLVGLLVQELLGAGVAVPGPVPDTAAAFTHWYHRVIELLEAQVAADVGRQAMTRSELEILCRCALSGRDLGEAIALSARFCESLHPRAGRLKLARGGELALFELDSLRLQHNSASSLSDIAGLFAFLQFFQWLIGTSLPLQQVAIGPVERDDLLPFLKLFQAPVLAGGSGYSLAFSAGLLELPVVRAAADFPRFFALYPCVVSPELQRDLVPRVAAILAAAARQGRGMPSQAALSGALGLSLSTFRRRLATAGASFRSLREDSLKEAALSLLSDPALAVGEVALRLGFSDAASFRRAFRQWQGTTPGEWRRTASHPESDAG